MIKKLLIVSGASRGLGFHIACRALENGYDVLGLARSETADSPFPIIECDVTEAASVSGAFRAVKKEPLYGLINAAGAAAMNLHMAMPPETMAKIVACNLLGTMYCCAEAGRIFARRKYGRIINFSSIAVAAGLKGEAAYAGAKAGIEGFSRSFAREMAPFAVTVNTIAPGPIPTALTAGVSEDKLADLRRMQINQSQLTRDDVWNVVSLLLDERAAPITGETLHLGGA